MMILCCALLLTGCASRSYRFEGVGADGRTGREIRHVLTSEAGDEGVITLEARGRAYTEVAGRETDTIRMTLVLDNRSEDAIEVPLDQLALVDDEGRQWRRAEIAGADLVGPDGGPPQVLVAPAKARTSFEVLYDAGAPGSLRTTGSVTLGWSYRFRGQTTSHESRFLPVRVQRTTYWGGGLYYGGRWGWGPRWGWGGGFGPAWCW